MRLKERGATRGQSWLEFQRITAQKTQVRLRLAEVPEDPSLQIRNFLFKFVQNKKSLEQDKMTFRIVLRQSGAIFCRNFQICYWRIYHKNLRICDLRTGIRNNFSGFAINEVHKCSDLRFAETFPCSPLHFRHNWAPWRQASYVKNHKQVALMRCNRRSLHRIKRVTIKVLSSEMDLAETSVIYRSLLLKQLCSVLTYRNTVISQNTHISICGFSLPHT